MVRLYAYGAVFQISSAGLCISIDGLKNLWIFDSYIPWCSAGNCISSPTLSTEWNFTSARLYICSAVFYILIQCFILNIQHRASRWLVFKSQTLFFISTALETLQAMFFASLIALPSTSSAAALAIIFSARNFKSTTLEFTSKALEFRNNRMMRRNSIQQIVCLT